MVEQTGAIEDILDGLCEKVETQGRVSVGDAIAAFGDRGWGPFLFLPALIEITPIGGIPAIPTLPATIIVIFAVQIVLRQDRMWLPGFLERRDVSAGRMEDAVAKVRPVARWLDRHFRGRLEALTTDRIRRVAAGVCIALCLTVPPLELLPFASTAPMAAIALFGLAMTFRDGAVMAAAFVAALAAAGFGVAELLGD